MPPELPDNQQRNSRHRVVEVMTRAQEDAMRQLRREGVPEQQALMVMERIAAFCLQTLRELDLVYREFEELVAKDGRSAAHQTRFADTAAALLTAVEAAIAGLVADAVRKARDDYQKQLSEPKDVITTVPPAPRSPTWQEALRQLGQSFTPWLLLFVGLFAWFLVWWQVSGLVTIGVIAVGVTAFMGLFFEKVGLWLSAVMGGVCLILLLLL
jgi:hypothetical protein